MMCSRLIRQSDPARQGRLFRATERAFEAVLHFYARSLRWALRNRVLMMVLLAATVVFNIYLYIMIPKGFFPQQDTGRLIGGIQADQAISFQSMSGKLRQFMSIVQADRPSTRSSASPAGARAAAGRPTAASYSCR